MNQPPTDKNDNASTHKKHSSFAPPSPKKSISGQSEKDDAIGNSYKPQGNEKQKINWPSWIQAVCTIAIVGVTFGYTYYASEQVDQVKTSIKITSAQFRLDQRAWLGITTNIKGVVEVGKPIFVSVGLKNTGKTPAKNITNTLRCGIINKNAPFVFPEKEDAPGIKSKSLLSPQQEASMDGTAKGDNALGDWADVVSGVRIFYIYGTVNYDDIFEKPHWLIFCLYYDSSEKSYKAYSEHNDTDND